MNPLSPGISNFTHTHRGIRFRFIKIEERILPPENSVCGRESGEAATFERGI